MSAINTRIGTPDKLITAIDNAVFEANSARDSNILASTINDNIAKHVKDYLAQKFNVAVMKADGNKDLEDLLLALYKDCTK
jgi:hypothetical protein